MVDYLIELLTGDSTTVVIFPCGSTSNRITPLFLYDSAPIAADSVPSPSPKTNNGGRR